MPSMTPTEHHDNFIFRAKSLRTSLEDGEDRERSAQDIGQDFIQPGLELLLLHDDLTHHTLLLHIALLDLLLALGGEVDFVIAITIILTRVLSNVLGSLLLGRGLTFGDFCGSGGGGAVGVGGGGVGVFGHGLKLAFDYAESEFS